jgi:hypothetical protein
MRDDRRIIGNARKRCSLVKRRVGQSAREGKMSKDDQVVAAALINISVYVDFQLERLESWLDETTDLLAWVGRNLLEIRFLMKYLMGDRKRYLDFINEVGVDQKEMLQKMVALKTSEQAELAEGLEQIIQHKTRLGQPLKRMSIRPEGSSVAVYQYYSKHIHPSSWLINNLYENLQSTASKIGFRAIAIEDALDAVEYLSVASQQLLKCED